MEQLIQQMMEEEKYDLVEELHFLDYVMIQILKIEKLACEE